MSSSTHPTKFVKVGGLYHVVENDSVRPRETVEVIAHHRPSNIPGKSVIVQRLKQAPNAAAPPHTHAGAAVFGLTIQGDVRNQMNSDAPFVSSTGECWYEAPGCHHIVGENASEEQSASFFAVLIVDDEVVKDGYDRLFVVDEEVKNGTV